MKGKADMLVANRTLSALIVLCLVFSAFAGFMFLTKPASIKAAAIGDLTVVNGVYTIENTVQPVDGNVTVGAGGELVIKDATLSIVSNSDPTLMHHMTVEAGGKVTLNHGTITTYLDQIDPWPFLTLTVTTGGQLLATGSSVLMFPGSFDVTAGGVVSLYDTIVESLPSALVSEFVVGTGGLITLDSADDGPSMLVDDSNLTLLDSSIMNLPEYPTDGFIASNLTVSGTSTLLAVNSFISVDFGPVVTPAQWFTHNVLVLSDRARAHLYGCSFAQYTGANADRAPAIVASGDSYVATPALQQLPGDDTGQAISSLLRSGEGMTYHVSPSQTMWIDSFNAGASGVTVDGATLVLRYKADSNYAGAESVMWSSNEGSTWQSTGITPTSGETSFVEKSYDLYAQGIVTTSSIASLDIRFHNSGTTGQIQFDSMSIVISIGPEAYIYRWLNVTVGDEYGVPIPGARISAIFTGSTTYGGQPSFYFDDGGVSPLPPDSVLAYLGKDASSFGLTGVDGLAVVPYLTDILSGGQAPNSLYIGSFSITGSATIGGSVHSSTENFSFPSPYPAMTTADQQYDFTVSIMGVSAQSPDTSRWLVVPPSLEISNMTYYHGGDVIVAADGTLKFYNAEFRIIQSSANQRTVYVDNTTGHPAMLIFEKSSMISPLWININVQGYAVLEVLNSTLQGVNIVARENSKVILANSTMDGKISTEWDASAQIIVKDSILDQAPLLSGTSTGHFTNSSVPSVTVERNALAFIYRWIHVTVLDAAGKPLPGALVTTHSYPAWIPGVQNGSAVSSEAMDSLGVAKVNSLASILTSAGPPYRYVGNYRVSGNYTHHGTTYSASQDIFVGVLPYSEPLEKNATYATMPIPGTVLNPVLPDLTLHQTLSPPYPVWTSNANPRPGDDVTVYARIYNDGASYAYNVTVNFYDDEQNTSVIAESRLFGTATVPMIRPGEYVDVQTHWIAGGLVAPNEHRLIVWIDPLNLILQPNATLVRTGYGFVTVQSLPDLYVFAGPEGAREIFTSTAPVIVNSTVTLNAYVHNIGALTVLNVRVNFSDDGEPIANATVSVPAGGAATASVQWTPKKNPEKFHAILVQANPWPWAIVELDYGNNNASVPIEVLDYPDLDLSAMSVSPSGSVAGGNLVIVTAALKNLNKAPVSNPSGELWVDYAGNRMIVNWHLDGVSLTDLSGSVEVDVSFTAPFLNARTDATLTLVANPSHTPTEKTYANNLLELPITILDVRPDLAVVVSDTVHDIYVQKGTQNVTGEMFGRQLTIYVIIHNLGGSSATSVDVQVGVRNLAGTYNHTLQRGTDYTVPRNATANTLLVSVPWTLNLTTVGEYRVWAWVDAPNLIAEPDESNNFAVLNFTLLPLDASVEITTDATEYNAGDMMVISALVKYNGTSEGVKGLPGVVCWLINPTTREVIPKTNSSVETTDETGSTVVLLWIPSDLTTGSYGMRVVIGTTNYDSIATIHVGAAVSGELFPFWLWIVIIVAVVGVVVGFFVYTYIYGLGKLVECGECGAFIPAASKRCPKCGVEFEAGTMKCSECGAWIPADSVECPNCGVKFVGEAEEEADYMERMRSEYDEMVSKYRELAKPELGKKYSEKAFDAWWKTQPGYITFEDWLAKEEEKKEGPIPCPVCGTLNPKEATVCHKCGTVFGAAKAAPPAEKKGPPPAAPAEERPAQAGIAPPVVAPRMVIRRPVDRKVVPKKIIKTPVGTEEKEGGEKEEENNQ